MVHGLIAGIEKELRSHPSDIMAEALEKQKEAILKTFIELCDIRRNQNEKQQEAKLERKFSVQLERLKHLRYGYF